MKAIHIVLSGAVLFMGVLAGAPRPSSAATTYTCGPIHISGTANVASAFLSCEVWYLSATALPAAASDTITLQGPHGNVVGSAGPTGDAGASGPGLLDFANSFAPPLGNSYICQVTLTSIPVSKVRVLLSVENKDAGGNLLSEQDVPCKLP
jgi:hypothetical protein